MLDPLCDCGVNASRDVVTNLFATSFGGAIMLPAVLIFAVMVGCCCAGAACPTCVVERGDAFAALRTDSESFEWLPGAPARKRYAKVRESEEEGAVDGSCCFAIDFVNSRCSHAALARARKSNSGNVPAVGCFLRPEGVADLGRVGVRCLAYSSG